MPWTAADAKGKTSKADTPKKQETWAKVANDALARCKKKGQGDCEARAIKQANAVVARMSEAWEQDFEQWFDQQDEETQGLLLLNVYGLKSALEAERMLRREAEYKFKAKESEIWSQDVKDILQAALYDEAPATTPNRYRYWIKDISVEDKFFVYQDEEGGSLYKRAYAIDPAGKLTLGNAVEVKVVSMYTPIDEAASDEILGDVISLIEKSVRKDGTIPVKIMGPGWGNSGYYSPEVLERDGPKVFTAGTKMFWDHPTPTEEAERPEGTLWNLAGELTSGARWESANILGPGLYSDAKIFSGFKDAIDELAPHIGVSIRGRGIAEDGEAEGREGRIIHRIAGRDSVDFVTMPGAGGKILQLFESARSSDSTQTGEDNMKELEELKEAKKQLETDLVAAKEATTKAEKARVDAEGKVAKLEEALLLRQAKDFVSEKLAKVEIPDFTRDRLVESLSKNPPVKDGKIDEEAFAKSLEEAVKAETEYLAKVVGSGSIRGMGASGDTAGAEEGRKALKESYKAKFESEGISPEQAEKMAKHAASGR